MSTVPPHLRRMIGLPLFRGLSEYEALGLLAIAQERSVAEGETLFKEGDEGDAIYLLLEGQMEITKSDRQGGEHALAKIADGGVLGEMSFLGGKAARSASARALTAARLLRIPADGFERLCGEQNVAALKVIFNLAQVLSRRLYLMDEKLVSVLDKSKRREELAEFQRILTDWSF